MRITVWEYEKILVSINPAHFSTEEELLKALAVQRYPDQEFNVRLDDGDERVDFMFDGSDGLDILAVLCYRGMADVAFSLTIPAARHSRYMKDLVTPTEEVLLAQECE